MSVKGPSKAAQYVATWAASYGERLHSMLVRHLRRGEDAADFEQDVYLKLMRLERFELVRNPLAYLTYLGHQAMRDRRMREERLPIKFDTDTIDRLNQEGQLASIEDFEAMEVNERELRRLLGKLSAAHRNVLILRKRDGKSYKDIAAELDLSVHTVKKYLFQAKVTLSDLWHP